MHRAVRSDRSIAQRNAQASSVIDRGWALRQQGGGDAVSDAALAALASCGRLRSLDLTGAVVTEAGLSSLLAGACGQSLRTLTLNSCRSLARRAHKLPSKCSTSRAGSVQAPPKAARLWSLACVRRCSEAARVSPSHALLHRRRWTAAGCWADGSWVTEAARPCAGTCDEPPRMGWAHSRRRFLHHACRHSASPAKNSNNGLSGRENWDSFKRAG